jgi:hypothetical protein
MAETSDIEEVQVSELRKDLRRKILEGKPLIVRKNSSVVALFLPASSSAYYPRRLKGHEGAQLRNALESILEQIG